MRIQKSHLKELIKQSIYELIEGGPGSGRKGGLDSGGPSYANVPKGAKSSKEARKMLKKKNNCKRNKKMDENSRRK